MNTGVISLKVADLNDYLIPASQAKRFKGLYYIRYEEEYTGDLNNPRKPMYTLEICKSKKGDELVSEYYKRTPLYKCWMIRPDLKIHEYWTKEGKEMPNKFSHVETKEEIKKFMEMALQYS